MTNELIKKLETLGGKRWVRDDLDRIYFNDYALGFKSRTAEFTQWGNINGADMNAVNGLKEVTKLDAEEIKNGKHYIDLATNTIHSEGIFKARIEYLILKAKQELKKKGIETEEKPFELTHECLSEVALRSFLDWRFPIDKETIIKSKIAIKEFLSFKIETTGKYAIVEVRLTSKTKNHLGKITIDLKLGRGIKTLSESYVKMIGEKEYVKTSVELKRENENFEESYKWVELNSNTINLRKREKKLKIRQALQQIAETTTAEAVRDIIIKSRKDTLMLLARAVEDVTGIHVSSKSGSETLKNVLLNNSDKFIGINLQTQVVQVINARKIRKIRRDKTFAVDEILVFVASGTPLKIFSKWQLIAIGHSSGIAMNEKMSKVQMLIELEKESQRKRALIA